MMLWIEGMQVSGVAQHFLATMHPFQTERSFRVFQFDY